MSWFIHSAPMFVPPEPGRHFARSFEERRMMSQQNDLFLWHPANLRHDSFCLRRGQPSGIALRPFRLIGGIQAENQPIRILEREIGASFLPAEPGIAR